MFSIRILMILHDANFTSIQAAIDSASSGDVILVHPGRYTSSQPGPAIRIDGKQLTLKSVGGESVTFIDGEQSGSGLYCTGYLDDQTVIEGFTFENCVQTAPGNAVVSFHFECGPIMRDCVIRNSTGVAISSYPDQPYSPSGSPHIIRCEIRDCYNDNGLGDPGGPYIVTTSYNGTIYEDCRFINNQAPIIAFNYWHNCTPTYRGCLFEGNTSWTLGILHARSGAQINVDNCIFKNNSMSSGCVIQSSNDGGGDPVFNILDTEFCGNDAANGICGTWNDLGGNTFEDECSCMSDVHPDGVIDMTDLLIVLAYFGVADPAAGDVNGDNMVGTNDILVLISNWGICE